MESLTQALVSTPEAAAGTLRQFSTSKDGVALLSTVLDVIVPAIVNLINQPPEQGASLSPISLKALENAAATLTGISTTDPGILSLISHEVPTALVGLAVRGVKGDLSLEREVMIMLESCAKAMEQIAHHAAGKTALREAGAIKQLGIMLVHCGFHPGCVLASSSALMGLSVEKESKVHIMLYAGQSLVKLMTTSKDDRLVCNARAAIQSASEHLEARRITQSLLTVDEMKGALYRGPLPDTPPDFRYNVVLPYLASRGLTP